MDPRLDDRARANEAARLSAAARDEADDLRKRIAELQEQVEILEDDRTDRDAWAVRICTEHKIYDALPGVADEFDAIAARLSAYRREMATLVEFAGKAVRARDEALDELERLHRPDGDVSDRIVGERED